MQDQPVLTRLLWQSAAVISLLSAAIVVLRPFAPALTWSVVIALSAWPINKQLRRALPFKAEMIAALLMTVLVCALILGIIIPSSIHLANEISQLLNLLQTSVSDDQLSVSRMVDDYPLIAKAIAPAIEKGTDLRKEFVQFAQEHQSQILSAFSFAAKGVGRFSFQLLVTIFSVYFFFRHGDTLGKQVSNFAYRLGGEYYISLTRTSAAAVKAVVFGVVGAAVTQGILAGIGFYICGAPLPVLLGLVTVILGLIPMGPPLLYLPVAIYLFLSGSEWYFAVGLAAWGLGIVSTIDNLVRPIFISQATHLPLLLAFFGGLGGIRAFGMVGLFVGPVILTLAHTVWLQISSSANNAK